MVFTKIQIIFKLRHNMLNLTLTSFATLSITYAFDVAHVAFYYSLSIKFRFIKVYLCLTSAKKLVCSKMYTVPLHDESQCFFHIFYYFYVVLNISGNYKPVFQCMKLSE